MAHITDGILGAAAYAPITVANAKVFLRIPSDVTTYDDYLTNLLVPGVIAEAETMCGGALYARTVTDELHDIEVNCQDRIKTYYRPIIQVYALTNDASAVSSSDYAVRKKAGIVVLKSDYFVVGYETGKISYQAGFTEAGFPNDLRDRMYMIVSEIYDEDYANKDSFYEKTGRSVVQMKIREKMQYDPTINRILMRYGAMGIT